MRKIKNFEEFLNENYEQAYNIKMLKNIKFMLHSWEFVDKDFQEGKEFRIAFTDKVKRKDVDKAIYDFVRKDKNADGPIGDMDIEWDADEFSPNILRIKNGNYAGLTYVFAALDKYYGKFGSSMGWD